MKKVTFLILGLIFLTSTSCGLLRKADIQPDDLLTVEIDNNSIEDFNRRTLCSVVVKDLKNPEILPLLEKVLPKQFELADGSSYMRLTLTESQTDSVKYSTEIDFGIDDKQASDLMNLLENECKGG